MRLPQTLKYPLTLIGEQASARTIHYLSSALNYMEVGRWMKTMGYDVRKRFERREQLWDLVALEMRDREVLYLEFGVGSGHATRWWAKMLRDPQSKLHGFDTFEGIPEDWNLLAPRGFCSVDGQIPQIADPRVQFFKGRFEDTLPLYKVPSHQVLVLFMDADLYSSTKFVLETLNTTIVPGVFIYFDEFNDRMHELRAFDEFIKTTCKKFSLLGVTRPLECALFKCIQ